MRILAVDIGTGTQDILLYDTDLQPENSFKLILPSPTMMVARQVKAATRHARPLLLTGVAMGGGPSHWAVRDHARAGNDVFATPEAAATFDDDPVKVGEMGIQLVDQSEAARLQRYRGNLLHLNLQDFDYPLLTEMFSRFGIDTQFDGVAVAVFDHGAAPPDVSDRQFRFDYLDRRIREHNRLSAFAYAADDIPAEMTRLRSVSHTATADGVKSSRLLVMDTAPAAVLGATCDPLVRRRGGGLIANVGNFHTLAFRLGEGGIDGLFEHHTGEVTAEKLDRLLSSLAASSLKNEDVFQDQGHGALVYNRRPCEPGVITVTGPRRGMMVKSKHKIYYAVPYGDMMITGCWGMIRAWADVFLDDKAVIEESLRGAKTVAPWELV